MKQPSKYSQDKINAAETDGYLWQNKKNPKTLLAENKLSAIYDRVNALAVRFRKRTVYLFKIKQILLERKTTDITKNGQVIKTINVRRKSKYLTGKNRLMF